jgi:hypothetical protein
MTSRRIVSLVALVTTAALTTACFVGPACGCGATTEPGETSAGELMDWSVGSELAPVLACEPVGWDLDAPLEDAATLTLHPAVNADYAGDVFVAVEVGDRIEEFTLTPGDVEGSALVQVSLTPGEPVAVWFTVVADTELMWDYAVSGVVPAEVLVTPLEGVEGPVPEACL